MTNLREPRIENGGDIGRQVTLGGTVDNSGNPAGNVVIADNPLDTIINPFENVFYYADATANLDQAANTVVASISNIQNYGLMTVHMVNTGGTTGKIKFRVDLTEDQSGVHTADFSLKNANGWGTLTELGHTQAGYIPNLNASAINILIDTQGAGETAAITIMFKGAGGGQ